MADLCFTTFESPTRSLHGGSETFRSNKYIDMLNRALRAETELTDLYLKWSRQNANLYTGAIDRSEEHRYAARELVRLIVANRGIPEDSAENLFGATRLVSRVGTFMPNQIRDRVYMTTAQRSETHIVKLLERIEKIAPLREKPILQSLRERLNKKTAIQ